MPSDYKFTCNECGWSGERYRNAKVCPKCGAPISREDKFILCYHGTTRENAKNILQEGFKPDSWFALHMEQALTVGGSTVIAAQLERAKIPKGWQFHVSESVSTSQIVGIYQITCKTCIKLEAKK